MVLRGNDFTIVDVASKIMRVRRSLREDVAFIAVTEVQFARFQFLLGALTQSRYNSVDGRFNVPQHMTFQGIPVIVVKDLDKLMS